MYPIVQYGAYFVKIEKYKESLRCELQIIVNREKWLFTAPSRFASLIENVKTEKLKEPLQSVGERILQRLFLMTLEKSGFQRILQDTASILIINSINFRKKAIY